MRCPSSTQEANLSPVTTPEISVVVCTRDRAESLELTLASLRPAPPSITWELLVVDNASEDDTQERLRRIQSTFHCELRILFEPEAGLAKARNLALREARAEVLLFLDDDVTCEPGLVEAHVAAFKDPTVVATGGRVAPRLPENTPQWFRDETGAQSGGPTARYDFGDTPGEIGLEIQPLPVGANFAIRRNAARENGGFNEALGWGPSAIPGEETQLLDKLASDKGRILYVPDATVHHRIPPERTTFAYFERWFERQGRFEAIRFGRLKGRARWIAIAGTSLRYLKWRVRVSVERDPTRRITNIRRLARTRGRWLELATPTARRED